jgi:hypothetical protein
LGEFVVDEVSDVQRIVHVESLQWGVPPG